MPPLWFACTLSALTMSLGWGLRGSIGGGPLGAMIPGAMIGLVLCILAGRERDAGTIAAFAAIGVGFGGQETYGQTVGLILRPETFWWAVLGFAIKGAVWGLLGGAFLGIAFDRARLPDRKILIGFALMVLGTWAGWILVNHPKLIYFSNRIDRPREELWAGLWLGGLLLLGWLRARIPWLFAVFGAVGGGVGFAFGASLQPWGAGVWASMPLGWWKAMELTFGALLGGAYAACAWRLREQLPPASAESAPTPVIRALALALVAIATAIVAGGVLPVRFGYTVAGAVLAAFALFSESIAWQAAITATFAAYSHDFLEYQRFAPNAVMWIAVIAATIPVAVAVARRPVAKPMFLLLTWTAVLNAFRYFLPPSAPGPSSITMLAVFTAFAAIATAMVRVSRPAPPRAEVAGASSMQS